MLPAKERAPAPALEVDPVLANSHEEGSPLPSPRSLPLVLDLDGTLTPSDTLWEGLLRAAAAHPGSLGGLLLRLRQGRARFKEHLDRISPVEPLRLPFHPRVVELARAEAAQGRRLVLATGACTPLARRIADHLGGFDEVLASTADRNLTGARKAAALVERFGRGGFIYAGNSEVDLHVWRESGGAILVQVPPATARRVRDAGIPILREIPRTEPIPGAILKALRPRQWLKNLLVFLPLFLSHRTSELGLALQACVAFACFSLAASMIYVTNDLLDLDSDRVHSEKRRRPFASGALPLAFGPPLALVLAACAAGLSLLLPWTARALLAAYVVGSTVYSFWWKRMLALDVVCLSTLYTARILMGGAATGIPVSMWTLAFSVFLFLSLAFGKRLIELSRETAVDGRPNARRAYLAGDAPLVGALAASAGFASILVVCLYLRSPEVLVLYRNPDLLWLACPALAYWLSRFLLLARRGLLLSDPVVFASTDRASWWTVGFIALVTWLAT